MPQIIPIPRQIDEFTGLNQGAVTFAVTLESKPIRLSFSWNARAEYWMMSVANATGEPLIEGVAVMSGYPLLRPYVSPDLPPGAMIVVDTQGTDTVPDLNGFGGANDGGGRWQLMYWSTAEIDALAA